nr:hypothetical protein [Clostridia bacterium]
MNRDYSWIFLDNAGKTLQNDAVNELSHALNDLEACKYSLHLQEGIGTEFCLDKIDDLQQTVKRFRDRLNSLS